MRGYRGEGEGRRVGAESDRKWGRMRIVSGVGGIELALDSRNADIYVQPRARGAQLQCSQPAFIIVMVMKLVSVTSNGTLI